MSVKRKKPTASASRKARAGRIAAGASRPSAPAKTKAAKAGPKKAASNKTSARKTTARKIKAKAAPRKAAAKARPAKRKAATSAKPKTAAPAKAKTTAKTARKTAKPKLAKGAAKAVRKADASASAGSAPASQDVASFAPIQAEADRFALHGEADAPASGGPAAAEGASPAPPGKAAAGTAGKGTADGGDAHAATPRANKLVPTNAVHTTKRRTKHSFWQGPTFGAAAAMLVLVLLVVGYRPEPPEVTPLEQRADAGLASDAPSANAAAPISDPVQAAPDRPWPPQTAATQTAATQPSNTQVATARTDGTRETATGAGPVAARSMASSDSSRSGLDNRDLIEMERLLARLDLGPSQADGIVDQKTETAIRMYQQIAGLPVDGKPTPELLDDMRAVVKMLDGGS